MGKLVVLCAHSCHVSGNSFPLSELTKRHNVKFGDLTAILLYEGAQSRDNKSSHVIRAAPRIFVTTHCTG